MFYLFQEESQQEVPHRHRRLGRRKSPRSQTSARTKLRAVVTEEQT
jgi:hypothetical protein